MPHRTKRPPGFDASDFDALNFSSAEHRNVVIVGSGPAGLAAALYAARANLEPLVLQGPEPGGQLITTTDVENYPGFPDGVLGPEMMQLFEAQAARFGAVVRYGMVTSVDFSERPFKLIVDEESPLLADAVIVATGASAKYLGLENEKRLLGKVCRRAQRATARSSVTSILPSSAAATPRWRRRCS